MLGILLAGGKASRLPNKLLLPVRSPYGTAPMVVAATKYVLKHAQNCTLLIEMGSVVPFIIQEFLSRYVSDGRIRYVNDSFGGINKALAGALNYEGAGFKDDAFICCGDNVYPDEFMPDALGCIVRKVALKRLNDLDYYLNGVWCPRSHTTVAEARALTTPWIVSADQLLQAPKHYNVLDWLNGINAKAIIPKPMNNYYEWDDLGTPAAYSAHWEKP